MVFQIKVIDGEGGGLIHSQAIMIDRREEGPVPGEIDRLEEAVELVLVKYLGGTGVPASPPPPNRPGP
jgi:hypothetical protein